MATSDLRLGLPSPGPRPQRSARLPVGGTDRNERLTTATGALLFVSARRARVTIVQHHGRCCRLHLFMGMLLIRRCC